MNAIPIVRLRGIGDKATRRNGQRTTLAWSALAGLLTEHQELDDKTDGAGFSPLTMADEPCTCGRMKDGKLICPGKLGHFIEQNVIAFNALMLDLDKYRDLRQLDRPGAELAMARLRDLGLRHVVHSTHSHSYPDHASLRTMIAVSRPVARAEWESFFDEVIRWLDIELDVKCSKTVGRFWYLPACKPGAERIAYSFEGEPIDVDDMMRRAGERAAAAPPKPAAKPPPPYTPRADAFDIRELMATRYPGARDEGSNGEAEAVWHIGGGGCPWAHEHSTKGVPSGTTVFLYPSGAWEFICQHSHCTHRNHVDFRRHHQPDWIPFEERPQRSPRSDSGPAGDERFADVPLPGEDDRPRGQPSDGRLDGVPHPAQTRPRHTDIGNAERFVAMHGDRLRYVAVTGKWSVWDGARWAPDEIGGVDIRAAREVTEQLWREADQLERERDEIARAKPDSAEATAAAEYAREAKTFARSSSQLRGLTAMATIARGDSAIAVHPDSMDADPWLLNVRNGTLDLRTGELRPHRQSDLITKMANATYNRDAPAPLWEAHVARVLPDPEVRSWVQRLLGYALTGMINEQVMAFFIGRGGNGKSVIVDTILRVMGDYAMRAAPDIVIANDNEKHPTAVADLRGRRLVLVSEIEQGRTWDEATIKRLTGDSTVKARYMRQDFFEFMPNHKLIVLANTKPNMRGTDEGIWRRMKLVPFKVQIPKAQQDTYLLSKLQADHDGVLSWLVRGCLEWQAKGLGHATEIDDATRKYQEEQDLIANWISEDCACVCRGRVERDDGTCGTCSAAIEPAQIITDKEPSESTMDLYTRFKNWCVAGGIKPWTIQSLRARLLERTGLTAVHTNSFRGIKGIRLRLRPAVQQERAAWG